MDDNQFLDLPIIAEPPEPEVYKYESTSRPYRFTRIYQTSYAVDNRENKEPGDQN